MHVAVRAAAAVKGDWGLCRSGAAAQGDDGQKGCCWNAHLCLLSLAKPNLRRAGASIAERGKGAATLDALQGATAAGFTNALVMEAEAAMGRDNALLMSMHVWLVIGALLRAPALAWRRLRR
jgi:hypothetical protein